MPGTETAPPTAGSAPRARGLIWAALLIAWVTIATAGIVVLAFHTVSPDHDSSATPATVPNFVPAPLATVPLAPVPIITVPSAPVVPPPVTKPAKHPTGTHVAAHPATHVGAVHTVHTIRTVTTVTAGGGTTASGPAGRTPQANTDPGTAVVVIPVTKNGGGSAPAKPVAPAGGHPVKVTGVGTTTDSTGEPTATPVIPPVLLPGAGSGDGAGIGSGDGSGTTPPPTGTGGDDSTPTTPPPTDDGSGTATGGGTDPANPPSDGADDPGTAGSGSSGHHHHHGHGHGHHGHHGCGDDSA